MSATCGHCRHWTRRKWRDRPDDGVERAEPEIGVCRGGPPGLAHEPTNITPEDREGPGPWNLHVHLGVWPHTHEDDHCGVWSPAVPAPDPAPPEPGE